MDSDQKLAREFATRPMQIWVLESMVSVIVLLASVTGNVFVIVSVYRNTRLRKPANLYIVSLAVTDLGFGMLVGTFGCGAVITGQWKFGLAVCWFDSIISYALALASTLTMLLIAVNRYYKIVKPNKYSSVFSLKFIVASILLAWILALAATLAVLLRGSGVRFHPGYVSCVPNVSTKDMPVLFTVYIPCAVLPCCIISLLYYKIWIFIKQHNAHMNESEVNQEELKLTRSLFVVVGSFIVCYTPYVVVSSLGVLFELFTTASILLLYLYNDYHCKLCESLDLRSDEQGVQEGVFEDCPKMRKKEPRSIACKLVDGRVGNLLILLDA